MFDFHPDVRARLVQDKIQGFHAEAERARQLRQLRDEQREERRSRREARQPEPALSA